jgi:DDE superfamily endonuclease/Helix-turn-helix of DDE superfamily endonuclease
MGVATPSPSRSALKRERERLWHQKRQLLEKNLDKTFSILKFLDDPKAIKYYTGFKNYQIFYTFYQFFKEDSLHMKYIGSKYKDSEATEWDQLDTCPKGKPRTLSKMDEMFMSLIRLRRDFDIYHLGNLFGLSEGQVSRIVNTWIMLMSNRLGQINLWQTGKSKTSLMVPDDAKEALANLKVIVDATELFTDKPSSTRAQKEIFSSYKNRTTGKCLVGVDGNGVITYYSRVYAGRTSDKKMIMHCGLLELLKRGDVMMADRGFDITKEMDDIGVDLLIPDFLNGKVQFSAEELEHSEKIAEIRVHVERAIRKIKEFHILKGPIPLTLAPMVDNIWACCAVLANFTSTGYLVKPKKDKK